MTQKSLGGWAGIIKERDNYQCQICFRKPKLDINLQAHHIKSRSAFPHLRHFIENGITLCKGCHQKIHKLQNPLEPFPKHRLCKCGHKKLRHSKHKNHCKVGRNCPCKEFTLHSVFCMKSSQTISAEEYEKRISLIKFLIDALKDEEIIA